MKPAASTYPPSTPPVILIAGGGTGGHVFPAVAVAEGLASLADVEVVFCGTDRGIEARVIPARGWRLERLVVEPMKGGGVTRAARGAFVAARATLHAFTLVRRIRPRAVLSVGGYASGPATLAAALLGVPVAILEPNSVPGLANRLLASIARRAYVAWDEAAWAFWSAAIRPFGVPLRAGFTPRPYAARDVPRLLVMGGSQGASVLNERLPGAIGAALARGGVHAVDVLHQAGAGRDAPVRDAYTAAGVAGVTVVPFIDDVVQAIVDADLVIARAGAGTLAEIAAIGRPSLLVPFPHAADDHQAKNAEALERAGAAVCLRQEGATVERLATEIARLLGDRNRRIAMARAAASRGRPNAAHQVAADLLALAEIPRSTTGTRGANGLHRLVAADRPVTAGRVS
jgi:UDP-N-acetylglucosamine--N-acetylmuramyl-(pentapeptide) pyrophosphoryl-undecaprenol N-acetylglucosamine transferase